MMRSAMSSQINPYAQGQVTEDPRFNERFGLSADGGGASPALWWVIGVPPNALGSNGDFAFRQDSGAATTRLYVRQAGAWVATAA